VNFKTDTIGKYLLDKKTQETLIEGFATSDDKISKSKNNNKKKDIITSLLDYLYSWLYFGYSRIMGDSYFADKIEQITQDNNQMMTVGFLFVLVSVILLMIEFTS
jgi:predicted RND superfamily exporter protein